MNEQNAGSEKMSSGSSNVRSEGVAAKSHEAAAQIKNAVVGRADQVRQGAESAKEQTAERIRRVATQLRNVGETLGEEDRLASAIADRAGRSVERVASYVASTDLRGFVRDTEDLARRQPALFFGGAFLAGLALGRFMKSSAPEGARRFQGGESSDDVRDTPRRDQRGMTSQRYRENYDATFARDQGSGVETYPTTDVGASTGSSSSSSGMTGSTYGSSGAGYGSSSGGSGYGNPTPGGVGGVTKPKDRAPESNGGSQRNKGKSS